MGSRKEQIAAAYDEREAEAWLCAPPVMIWMTDENHLCTFCNRALMDFFGFAEKDIQGLNWMEAIHPEDRERIRAIHSHATKHYQNVRMEYRAKGGKQADYVWILDISVPRFDARGKFLGYVGSSVDISEQKAHEAKLKERQQDLEKEVLQISDREMFRIGRDLHDELSQHLLGVALKAMLLERKLKGRGLAETKIAGELTEEVNRAIAKTRRVSQSLFPLSLSRKDLRTVLAELQEKVKQSFGVELELRLQKDALRIDPEKGLHLYRIIQEAVTNGVRHGKAKKIQVALTRSGDRHCLEIKDDGIGIVDPPSGEGMGLSIMKYRAHLVEGDIVIRRRTEGGTVVRCEYRPEPVREEAR